MCGGESTRREFVTGALFVAAGGLAGCARPDAAEQLPEAQRLAPIVVADGLAIHPRDDWGADLPPKGPMGAEDVRFLLIHHTESSNNIPSQRNLIRQVYAFHTGPQKRWNDVAYNFFVGSDGSVWEGRAGSLAGPIIAGATGGNQGYSQLVCLLGDFRFTDPTPQAQQSLVKLLAHLAIRYDLNTWKNATAEFISRGSNKWAAGAYVATSTISGHRDMSYTDCPGDNGYALLPTWRSQVHPLVVAGRRRPGLQPADRLALHAP